jgi:hypothetical protein
MNHQPGQEPLAPHQQEEEPSYRSKQLRLSSPDLTIVCSKDDEEKKPFDCHSLIMAGHSKYFDSLLSSEMQESITKEVTLENVSPAVFEQGMRYLENPSQAMTVSVEEILQVAPFYNRF